MLGRRQGGRCPTQDDVPGYLNVPSNWRRPGDDVELGQWHFHLAVAPVRFAGTSGSPVDPIATF